MTPFTSPNNELCLFLIDYYKPKFAGFEHEPQRKQGTAELLFTYMMNAFGRSLCMLSG